VSSRLLQNFDDKETGVQVCVLEVKYHGDLSAQQLVQLGHGTAGWLAVCDQASLEGQLCTSLAGHHSSLGDTNAVIRILN
jgi:hypothetical protein